MSEHYLDQLATFCTELEFDAVPPEVVERSLALVLDFVAVALAGCSEERVHRVAQQVSRRGSIGRSTFVVDGERGDAADAALVNGLAACVHVLDEGHKFARGHVGTYVLPAVLAVAEERQASGAEFISALVAGYEIAARLGMACRVRTSMHPSGTWGTLGGAAAAAKLMGLGSEGIRSAMNVAAPLTLATSWQAAECGATVRDLYSGKGAQDAVNAPRWVEAGFTGCDDDVSHVFGRVSSESFDRAVAADGLGARWEMLRNYFKVHACCRNFQSGIDAALLLRRQHGLSAGDVLSITAETYAVPARDNVSANPANVLAAKESFPVSLALTLVNGKCDESVFTETRVRHAEVSRLAANCEVLCDPQLDAMAPEQRPSRITLSLRDGTHVTATELVAIGDPSRPLTDAQLHEKADRLVAGALGAERTAAVKLAIAQLPDAEDLYQLTSLLRRT